MIETGRHKKLEREMRICPLCYISIEDEVHLLFDCPAYRAIRDELFSSLNLTNTNFEFYSNNEKLEFLMINLDKNIGKFILSCFEIRTFLLNNHKTCD